jgi:hypothetical protein
MIRVVYPGSKSQIRILIFYPSRIPDPGVKKARISDPGPQHCLMVTSRFLLATYANTSNDIRRPYLYAGAGLVISQLVLQVLEVAGHDLAAEGEGG